MGRYRIDKVSTLRIRLIAGEMRMMDVIRTTSLSKAIVMFESLLTSMQVLKFKNIYELAYSFFFTNFPEDYSVDFIVKS